MSRWSDITSRFNKLLEGRRKYYAAGGLLVIILAAILLLRSNDDSIKTTDRPAATENTPGAEGTLEPGAAPTDSAAGPAAKATRSATGKRIPATTVRRENVGVEKPKTGTIPPGINYADQVIKVVYYWDSSSSGSQFLEGTGAAQNAVDDGLAFKALAKFINNHIDGSASLMGTQIKMGNWLIDPIVEAQSSRNADPNVLMTKIANEHKPFAAINARGSLSTNGCPPFAAAKIHNFATLDYSPNIAAAYNGYCLPGAISWAQQVDATTNYLSWHKGSDYQGPEGGSCPALGCDRVFGFVYTEYPGLNEQGPAVVTRLRAAGLNIPQNGVASLTAGLSNAPEEPPAVINQFRGAGVNTVIMPDGGTALKFTIAADNKYFPDYYVWPCSGQDTTGFTRLLPPGQWDRASGLTCYDDTFDADLTADQQDRASQWYKAYQEISPGSEPPASTYLVYASLQPIVVGVSNLGTRPFNVENFRAGLKEFQPYRYHGATGRTDAGDNILLRMGNSPDASPWGDVARVSWSPGPEPYSYPEGCRYTSSQSFPC